MTIGKVVFRTGISSQNNTAMPKFLGSKKK